jgi:hypothetical protein
MERKSSLRRRPAAFGLIVVLTGALVVGVGVLPAQASISAFSVSGTPFQLAGKPYTFRFSTSRLGTAGASATFTATRTATTGNKPTQSHQWSVSIDVGDASFSSDLKTVSIVTGDDMHQFGEVDLTLHNPSPLHTTHLKCPNDTVYATTTMRTGTMTGTMDFDANDNYFHTVHKTSMPVTVSKTVYSDNGCPTPPPTCVQGFSFQGNDMDAPLFVTATRALTGGKAVIDILSDTTVFPAFVTHEVSFTAPLTAFKVSKTFLVTLNGGAGAPFASGIIKFSKSGSPTVTTEHHCKTTTQQGSRKQGTLTAKFDSDGPVTMNSGDSTVTKHAKV